MTRSRGLDASDSDADAAGLAPGRRTLSASLPSRPAAARTSGAREIDPARRAPLHALGGAPMAAPATEAQLAAMPSAGPEVDPEDAAVLARLLELNGTPASSGRARQQVAPTDR